MGEFVHDFVPSFKRRYIWWNTWGGKVSGLVLIAALAAELMIQVKTNSISGQVIAFLGDRTATAVSQAAALGVTFDNLKETVRQKTDAADTAIAALNKATTEAEQKLATLQERQTQRRLKSEEIQALVAVLLPFAGQKASVSSVTTDDEACTYANDFLLLLKQAKWDLGDNPSVNHTVFIGGDVGIAGIQISINQNAKDAGNIPSATWPFVNELLNLNLIEARRAFVSPGVTAGTIEVRIGPRPPLP